MLSNKAIRLRRIMPSKISIILQMIRKPNLINVLLFIQNNLSSKTSQNMLNSINVKFIFNCPFIGKFGRSSQKGLFSAANILPRADVFLLCFKPIIVCLFLPRERSEMLHQFVLTTKTT